MAEWRVGRSLGRTLYRGEVCVGMVDSPELAAEIVETMNRVGRLLDEVRAESGRERSLWSDPVYTDRCSVCDHPDFMHRGARCLGDFMSCGCVRPEPRDAERRSEATPQKDLPGFRHLGDIPAPIATAEELAGATVIPVPPEQADKIREAFGWRRVDPYDTTKGGITDG